MATTKWTLDPAHSDLGFKIRHLMISNVSGSFQKFDVEVETEDDDFFKAKVIATADVSSISTNNAQRDEHLRTADFFEVQKHPKMTFRSTRIEKAGGDNFNLYGDLTIKETTKPVKLDVEYAGITKDP